MKITQGIRNTIPYAIIAGLALLNGPAMAKVICNVVKKELVNRDKNSAKRAFREDTFRTMLTRLKKQGLVENPSRGIWRLTKKGSALHATVSEKYSAYGAFLAEHGNKRDTIIIFDVSEKKSAVRNYLRGELESLGYELLQKSVWIGGSPLPEIFLSYLKNADLLSSVHIFTIEKRGTMV